MRFPYVLTCIISSVAVLTTMKVSASIICVAFDVVSSTSDFVLGFKLILLLAS